MKKKILPIILGTMLLVNYQNSIGAAEGTMAQSVYTREDVITDPNRSLELLKQGHERFLVNQPLLNDLSRERRLKLKEGQFPFATIVSCSDSRVDAPHIFDQGLGDLFEVKLAGNIVDADAMGSIEFGTAVLNVPLIVVLGHEKCGAVHSSVDVHHGKLKLPKESAINSVVNSILPSVKKAEQNPANKGLGELEFKEAATVENAREMRDVILKNPAIRERVEQNKVKVVVATYMLDGTIVWE